MCLGPRALIMIASHGFQTVLARFWLDGGLRHLGRRHGPGAGGRLSRASASLLVLFCLFSLLSPLGFGPPYPYVLFLFCLVAFLDVFFYSCVLCVFLGRAPQRRHPAWCLSRLGPHPSAGAAPTQVGARPVEAVPPVQECVAGSHLSVGHSASLRLANLYREVGNGARRAPTVGRRLEFGISELRF